MDPDPFSDPYPEGPKTYESDGSGFESKTGYDLFDLKLYHLKLHAKMRSYSFLILRYVQFLSIKALVVCLLADQNH